ADGHGTRSVPRADQTGKAAARLTRNLRLIRELPDDALVSFAGFRLPELLLALADVQQRAGCNLSIRPVTADHLAKLLDGAFEISDRKSTRLNSSHDQISYAVFCLKKKKKKKNI